MDRRTLLKSAAAASAAAIVPAVAVEAAPVVAEVAAPIQAPAKLSPYGSYVWEWFVSNDGETYYEPFPTKEEAMEYARSSEYSLVAECIQQDFDLGISGYWLLDHINDQNYELIGEGEGVECTSEQERDLEAMVQRAIEAWVVKHNISLTAWSFAGVRNETAVEEVTT
jgi:hypothetical protein